jgi:hypothetical protein
MKIFKKEALYKSLREECLKEIEELKTFILENPSEIKQCLEKAIEIEETQKLYDSLSKREKDKTLWEHDCDGQESDGISVVGKSGQIFISDPRWCVEVEKK